VGPVTALAFALTLGPAERFQRGRQVGSYFGLIPSEHSSGGKQRLGHISKQGSSFVRGLLVEAAQSAVRQEPQLRREYRRLSQRRCRALAKVAIARKLAVRLYWMLREEVDYAQLIRGSHAGQPESFRGRGQDRSVEWAPCLPEKSRGIEKVIMVVAVVGDRINGWWDLHGYTE